MKPSSVPSHERRRRVDQLLSAFGLQNQAHTIVGTPIRKGISGGQKRRLSIASQLITAPKILFLDEPTRYVHFRCKLLLPRIILGIGRHVPEQKAPNTLSSCLVARSGALKMGC